MFIGCSKRKYGDKIVAGLIGNEFERGHKAWIVEHEKRITKGANVYTILITNSDGIDEDAHIYADDILCE